MLRPGSCLIALSLALVACGSEPGPDEDVGASGEALTTVPLGPNKVDGIDVSHYQGTIDWAAEKTKGRVFGVASVGDGTYQDPMFAANWTAMKKAGVIRGAYQYFEPGTDPIVQADILIAKVGMLGVGDLPATIDVETTGGKTQAQIATAVGKWLTRVEAGTGRKPMIYTGPYFWQDNVASTSFGSYPLWVADYGVASPKLPAPWTKFKIWQYTDSNGALDVDHFNGTLAELQAFAKPPKPPVPPADGGDASVEEPVEPGPEATPPPPPVNPLPPPPPPADGGCNASSHAPSSNAGALVLAAALVIATRRRRAR